MDQIMNNEEKAILSSGATVSIVTGIVLIIVSIYILSNPGISIVQLITLMGIYLVIKGTFDFFSAFSSKVQNRGWNIFGGIVAVIAGILILAYPILASYITITFYIWLIAFALIIHGILSMKESVAWGIISIIVGILLLFVSTLGTAAVLIWLIGFMLLFLGIFSIIAGAKLNFEAKKIA
jgi:uncharacterized membrane protein HdeD (DUF308 family)